MWEREKEKSEANLSPYMKCEGNVYNKQNSCGGHCMWYCMCYENEMHTIPRAHLISNIGFLIEMYKTYRIGINSVFLNIDSLCYEIMAEFCLYLDFFYEK